MMRHMVGLAIAVVVVLVCAWIAVVQPVLPQKTIAGTARVSPERLQAHVRALAESFIPRDYNHPENLDRAAAYIRNEFAKTKGAVSEQKFEMEGKTYRNVMVSFGPEKGDRIVVGAHYDAYGEFPAADDNASGVAGVIELAGLLDTTPLPVRVELVAFTLEEPKTQTGDGLFRSLYGGSAVHARSLRMQGARVRMMLSLEMIGYFSDEEDGQHYPSALLRLFYPFVLSVSGELRDDRWPASGRTAFAPGKESDEVGVCSAGVFDQRTLVD